LLDLDPLGKPATSATKNVDASKIEDQNAFIILGMFSSDDNICIFKGCVISYKKEKDFLRNIITQYTTNFLQLRMSVLKWESPYVAFYWLQLGLGREFCLKKIPRNRLGTVSIIPRKKELIPRHFEFRRRTNSEAQNGTEQNGIPRKNEVLQNFDSLYDQNDLSVPQKLFF
jgi:hypothetical protein